LGAAAEEKARTLVQAVAHAAPAEAEEMKRRDWRNNWRERALRATSAVITLCIFCTLLSSCATSEEVRLRMRVQELEQIVANKDDDLNYLMTAIAKQQSYIGELERGAMMQAQAIAKFRDGNCQQ